VLQISCQAFFIHLPLQEDRRAASMSVAASPSHVSQKTVSWELTTLVLSNGVKIRLKQHWVNRSGGNHQLNDLHCSAQQSSIIISFSFHHFSLNVIASRVYQSFEAFLVYL
jgi:hypothetical protein